MHNGYCNQMLNFGSFTSTIPTYRIGINGLPMIKPILFDMPITVPSSAALHSRESIIGLNKTPNDFRDPISKKMIMNDVNVRRQLEVAILEIIFDLFNSV